MSHEKGGMKNTAMNTLAVVLDEPKSLRLAALELSPPTDEDIVVDIEWSGISTGTERLLWSGRMPTFPGMGYPLIPGYESVGRITGVGADAGRALGERVFVPGARCFGDVRGLFGGAASRVVVPAARALPIGDSLGEDGVLLALAATAHHALAAPHRRLPDLIIGHGVLGRILARLAMVRGAGQPPPTVWEIDASRRGDARGYPVLDPADDPRRDYRSICDVSGDAGLLDTLIGRLAPGGEIVLAGFYDQPLSFSFAPAFIREARLAIAAQWQPEDLAAVNWLVSSGRLALDGLITHRAPATDAPTAYRTAFGDPDCLKMVLDWRHCS